MIFLFQIQPVPFHEEIGRLPMLKNTCVSLFQMIGQCVSVAYIFESFEILFRMISVTNGVQNDYREHTSTLEYAPCGNCCKGRSINYETLKIPIFNPHSPLCRDVVIRINFDLYGSLRFPKPPFFRAWRNLWTFLNSCFKKLMAFVNLCINGTTCSRLEVGGAVILNTVTATEYCVSNSGH